MSTELSKPPSKSISEIQFCNFSGSESDIIVSSWDNSLRLYNTSTDTLKKVFTSDQPLLCCTYLNNAAEVASSGLSKQIRLYNFENERETLCGTHSQPVSCISYQIENGLLYSGSWDRTVCVWDVRMSNLVYKLPLLGKVYAMAHCEKGTLKNKIIVTDSSKRVYIYDDRKFSEPEVVLENLINHLPRCLKTFADGEGFAIGTVEGRVHYQYAIDCYEKSNATSKSYTFKCHRLKTRLSDNDAEIEKIYPVHSIAFTPNKNEFCTGGGDGTVAYWDGVKKKRMWNLKKPFGTAVVSLVMNSFGTKIALGVSDDACQLTGKQQMHMPHVVIHEISRDTA